jgi:AcrR family transcriptional regulator
MAQAEDTTRSRILDAAGAVFAEHGFDKATIREICARAEVNLASVNYHFGDKQKLYVETIRYAHEEAVAQAPLPQWPLGTTATQKLRDLVHNMIRRMLVAKRLPWQTQLMMREFTQPTGVCRELADEYIKPHFALMLEVIGELVPEETPLHRRRQIAFSLIGQCTFYRFHGPVMKLLVPEQELSEHFSTEQLADHISQFMLSALGAEPMF